MSCRQPALPTFYKAAMAQALCKLPLIAIFAIFICTTMAAEGRSPIGDPVQCAGSASCTISNVYGSWPDRLPCTAAQVVYPTTEAEILSAVASAVQKKQKMKVVSKYAHSVPKLICPGGSEGLVISTRDYNRGLVIDREKMTVMADSGIQLRQLLDGIAAAGLALPQSPYWQGVSLGGLLSTGSHGSSWQGRGGGVHEYVVGMRLVVPARLEEGYAKVIQLTEGESLEQLNAAKVSLGVLGVISKVTLQLEPMFKRSITYHSMSDDDLEDRILPFADEHEFGDITWHPSQRKASYRLDYRVPIDVAGDGIFDFVGFRPISPAVLGGIRSLENLQERTNNAEGKCMTGRLQVRSLELLGKGLRKDNNSGFWGYPVVGYQNQMQTSGSCLSTDASDPRVCAWDNRVNGEFYFETAFSMPVSKVQGFIQDVKALRDAVVEGFCGLDLYYGMYMRYVKASTAYMGTPYDSVAVDLTYYRARTGGQVRLLEDVMEEVEQMAAFKHGGKPHWGKNRAVAFLGVGAKHPNLQRFLRVKEELDPEGLFSSEWSDFLMGLAPTPQPASLYSAPGCALEGLCICSNDAHCAPHLGYLCQPGRVYLEARVCRKVQ